MEGAATGDEKQQQTAAAARGPFTVRLKGDMTTLGQLKDKIIQQMTMATPQKDETAATAADRNESVNNPKSTEEIRKITGRWIIARNLVDDDTKTLAHYGLTCQEDVKRAGLIYFYILGTERLIFENID